MNVAELSDRLGLEQGEYLELLSLFIEATASDLAGLQDALSRGNVEVVIEAAHSIKGAAGNLGLSVIHETARSIELKARRGSLEGVPETAHLLRERIDVLCGMLGQGHSSDNGVQR